MAQYIDDDEMIQEDPSVYDPRASQEFVDTISSDYSDPNNNHQVVEGSSFAVARYSQQARMSNMNNGGGGYGRPSMTAGGIPAGMEPAGHNLHSHSPVSSRISSRSPRLSGEGARANRRSRMSTSLNHQAQQGLSLQSSAYGNGQATTEPQHLYNQRSSDVPEYENMANIIQPPGLQESSQATTHPPPPPPPAFGVGIYEGSADGDDGHSGGGEISGGGYDVTTSHQQHPHADFHQTTAVTTSEATSVAGTADLQYQEYGAAVAMSNPSTTAATATGAAQYNSMASSTTKRPLPKAAIPVEPDLPRIEPSLTNLSKLSKRAATSKRRPVDFQLGSLEQNSKLSAGSRAASATYRIQCPTCATLLYNISKSSTVVHCPTCDAVHIAASCPVYMEQR